LEDLGGAKLTLTRMNRKAVCLVYKSVSGPALAGTPYFCHLKGLLWSTAFCNFQRLFYKFSFMNSEHKAVARWLMLGVAMLVIQVLLGGVTRLTGSGLSITEWKPLLGAIPPLNDADWQLAFQKYQGIAQYQYLNSDFTLGDFKTIYFWEWMHREWARLMGLVFLAGFVWFLYKRQLTKAMIVPFAGLFLLGGLQGALGWIMVKSGLNATDLYVSHIRLAIHFMAALLLVAYTFWMALSLRIPPAERTTASPALKQTLYLALGLLTVQLTYGAFMAGLKAAQVAPTWPGINRQLLPGNISRWGNQQFSTGLALIDHPLAVHFIHRTGAFLLCVLIAFLTWQGAKLARRQMGSAFKRWYRIPLILVGVQAVLGILTVRVSPQARYNGFGPFEMLAEAHQLVAMALVLALLALVFAISGKKPAAL
jgi:cytochrome c oxidase assembly protein subunit 15